MGHLGFYSTAKLLFIYLDQPVIGYGWQVSLTLGGGRCASEALHLYQTALDIPYIVILANGWLWWVCKSHIGGGVIPGVGTPILGHGS